MALAKLMAPVREGNSTAFWKNACGVKLGGADDDSMGGFYQPRDNWYIYYVQGFHGQFLFRVPRAQAVAAFPEVVRRIEMSASQVDAPRRVRWAAAILERNPPAAGLNPEQFLSLMRDEWLNTFRDSEKSHYDFAASEEQRFAQRWIRVRRYWMNVVFESAFFGGLSLFAIWPWLRGKRSWSWGLHLGSLPVLLLLPYYCGYASWTFTSTGLSGGVLYPWAIMWSRDFPIWTGADRWARENIPQLLGPLSQPLGPMLCISGGHGLGPVTALAIGAGIAICISVGVSFAKLRKVP